MKPICFELNILVKPEDIDELGHVNNVKYFNYLQEAAIAHWYGLVPTQISDGMRWVVKKHEIEYFNAAFVNDNLIVKTWIAKLAGVSSHRYYEIWRENTIIVKANTLWVALDFTSMKPKRIDALELAPYFFEG